MSQPKKYKERKGLHDELMTRTKKMERAHHLQKSKLALDLEVAYFVPALAGLVFVVLLAVFAFFLVDRYWINPHCDVPSGDTEPEIVQKFEPEIFSSDLALVGLNTNENLQKIPRPKIISNLEVLSFDEYLATLPKNEIFDFAPSELPVKRIFEGLQIIAKRANDEEHLIAETLRQTEILRDLYNMNIRNEILNIAEESRAFFLNSHLLEIENELNSTRGLEFSLEHIRSDLEAGFNVRKNKYEQNLAQYNLAFENYDGNNAEFSVASLAEQKAEMEAFAQRHQAYGDVLVRLSDYADALAKKLEVMQNNFDALVSGFQVTFDNEVDLGLIK